MPIVRTSLDPHDKLYATEFEMTMEASDFVKWIDITDVNPTPIANGATRSIHFIFPNEYIVDTHKSFIIFSNNGQFVINYTRVYYNNGVSHNECPLLYSTFQATRSPLNIDNKLTDPAGINVQEIYRINPFFSDRYYHCHLLNGITKLELNITNNNAQALDIQCKLYIINNTKVMDFYKNQLLANGRLTFKIYQMEAINGVNLQEGISLGYFQKSMCYLLTNVTEEEDTDFTINVGNTSKNIIIPTLAELNRITLHECPYTDLNDLYCVPLYSLNEYDFSGTNCQNLNLKVTANYPDLVSVVTLFNAYMTIRSDGNIIIGTDLDAY